MDVANFSPEVRALYEAKVAKLQQITNDDSVDNAFLWDNTVKKYATKMKKVKNILETDEVKGLISGKLMRDMDAFLNRCKDAEFHIALVGAIKAGKSTLINALLGYRYASTKVTPETASLTKFKKGETNFVKVSFYSAQEWADLWKSVNEAKATVFLEEYAALQADSEKNNWVNHDVISVTCDTKDSLVSEIQKWTSSKSASHYFVKEVEVGLVDCNLPTGVVLVDTPGLDDIVEYRSEITRDYIDRANAVLVCVKADSLTGQEMTTISRVFANTRYNPEKVYIIATQLDTLNHPISDWKQQKEEWLKHLKEKGAFGSRSLAEKNLIPVSAYLYSLLKEYNSLDEDSEQDLNIICIKLRKKDVYESYDELIAFSQIDLLKNKIQKELVSKFRDIMLEDITGSFEICRESIRETMQKISQQQQEIITTCQNGMDAVKEKQNEYSQKKKEAEKDKKELDAVLKQFKIVTTKRAEDLQNDIRKLAYQ